MNKQSMQAWVVSAKGAPAEVLKKTRIPLPAPGPGFLRIKVAAAAIGLPDVLMCRGTYPLTPPGSFVPGQEIVGVVTAVGEGVDSSLLGTRRMGVTAFYIGSGGFAEEALAAENTVFPAPDWLSDADAAGFHIPFYTAWVGLHERAAIAEGETLVVLGAAGGSGSAAIQLGRALGSRVVAVAGGEAKAQYCREIGADLVIDHQQEDIAAAIKAATEGLGADVIFDPVGGTIAENVGHATANEGRFLLVGFASGSWPRIDPATVVQRNFSVVGVFAGAYDRDHAAAAYAALMPKMQHGSLRSVVTKQISFDEVPGALEQLANRSAIGKWVILAPEV